MSTVYVVTKGEYSDYRILGIFSTKELAELAIATLPQGIGEIHDVVEWELDEYVDRLKTGLLPYGVYMREDGSGLYVLMREDGSGLYHAPACQALFDVSEEPLRVMSQSTSLGRQKYLYGVVIAKSVEHATKIANERRLQFIASGEWERSPH